MLARYEQPLPGTALPEIWTEEVRELLTKSYQQNLLEVQRYFEVFGMSYPNELLVTISLKDHESRADKPPLTYMISVDLLKEADSKKILATMVDSMGLFLDNLFADYAGQEYQVLWEKATLGKIDFYYKISREDIALSLQAEKLLNENPI